MPPSAKQAVFERQLIQYIATIIQVNEQDHPSNNLLAVRRYSIALAALKCIKLAETFALNIFRNLKYSFIFHTVSSVQDVHPLSQDSMLTESKVKGQGSKARAKKIKSHKPKAVQFVKAVTSSKSVS